MQAPQDDIDFSGMAGAIKRGLPKLVAITALAGGLTYGALTLVPPTYKSTAQVILESAGTSLLRPSGQSGSSEVKIDENEVASQAEVIRSRDLLSEVVSKESLEAIAEFNPALRPQGIINRLLALVSGGPAGADAHERALNILELNTRVGEVPKTRLINIDVTSHDANLAARLANAIAQAFLDRNRASQVKDASDATTSLGVSIAEVKAGTEAAEAALERFRAESGLLSGQNNVTLNNQQLSELNTQLTQATAARTEAEARSRILRDMIATGHVEDSQDVVKSPNMQQLFQQKLRVERDIAELSATLMPGHPRMQQLAAELATTNARLREEAKQVAAGIEDDLKVASAREAALKASLAQLTETALKSSDAQAKLSSLEREAQSKRNTYDGLLQRLSEASSRRSNASVSAMASLNESAVASVIPDSPKKTQMSIFAALGTLLFGLVIVIGRELMGGTGRAASPVPLAKAEPAGPARAPAGHEPHLATAAPAHLIKVSGLAALAAVQAHGGHGAGAGRVLLTGESDGQDIASVASDIANKLAGKAAELVLVDLTSAAGSPGDAKGLAELANGKATFEDVVRPGASGRWHQIGAGAIDSTIWTSGASGNLVLVLSALGAIYKTVLIAAGRDMATKVLEALEGQIDLGIVSAAPGRPASAPVEEGFLGYDVADLTVLWLDSSAKPAGRSTFSRKADIKVAPVPA